MDAFTRGMNASTRSSPLSEMSLFNKMIPSRSTQFDPAPSIVDTLPPLKLNSSTGRHVKVDPDRKMDVGRAFRSLEILCARNSVKRDFMRLKSERWRKNFKAGFKETVKLVMKMKKQGW
jgi:small subunit ribosomal protein MRP21